MLEAIVRREEGRRPPEPAESELLWSASSLVATWLHGATPMKAALSEEEAGAMLRPGRLAELMANGVVRIVLGEVALADRVQRRQLGSEDQADATRLREALHDDERDELWIEAQTARAAYERHASGNPSTPPWEEIAGPAFLEPRPRAGVDGFVLQIGRGAGHTWLTKVQPLAAAKLWVRLIAEGQDGSTALRAWLERIDSWKCSLDAPAHLPRPQRDSLLIAALRVLEEDPNLGDLQSEVGSTLGQSDVADLSGVPTCAALHMFWTSRRRDTIDAARFRLQRLISIILQFDIGDGSAPPPRIIALTDLARRKPYVVSVFRFYFRANRPSVLAWLLTSARTAALALLIIADLPIQEQTTSDDLEDRAARLHARLMLMLADALPIASQTLALAQLDDDERSDVVPAIVDILRGFARRTSRNLIYESGRNLAEFTRAKEVFSVVSNAILDTTAARQPGVASTPSHHRFLVEEIAEVLFANAPEQFPTGELVALVKVDLEFLRFLRERRVAFASRSPDFVPTLERLVRERIERNYERALAVDAVADDFRHHFRETSLVDLPWEYFACAAYEGGKLENWLHLPRLRARLLGAASSDDRTRAAILAGYSERLRTHLEVLLRAHAGNSGRVLATADVRVSVREALESAIEDLVVASTDVTRGTVDLFDEEISLSFRDEALPALVPLVAAAFDRFEPTRRDRALVAWIRKTTNADILLAIEKSATSLPVQKVASERLAEPAVLKEAEEGGFVRALELVERAAEAKHEDLVARLVARGENVFATHPWRDQWEERVFRAQLLLLYGKEKNRTAMLAHPLPPSATGDTAAACHARESLERARQFYLALHDLDVDPAAAEASFSRQLESEPESTSLLVNVFVAKLKQADRETEPAIRRAAFSAALTWWDRVAPPGSRASLDPHGMRNALFAIDRAQLDDEFDRRWSQLDEPSRSSVDILRLRIENVQRRGLVDEATHLIALAKRLHGPTVLEVMKVTEHITAVLPPSLPSQEDYCRYWTQICHLPATDMSVVLGHRGLQDYLLHIHVNACERLLRHLVTVLALGQENRANEFVAAFVAMQVEVLGWFVPEQSPGGVANTEAAVVDGTPASRDWTICQGPREIAVCEAMRLDSISRSKIDEHVTKLVDRYNPTGTHASVVIVYFEGSDFDRFAQGYREHVGRSTPPGVVLDASASWFDLGKDKLRAFRVNVLEDGRLKATQDHILLHLKLPMRSSRAQT